MIIRPEIVAPLSLSVMIQALVSANAITVAVLAPVLAPALGLEPVAAGSYIALVYLIAAIASSFASKFLARFSPGIVATMSLGFSTAGTAFLLSGEIWLFALGGTISGIGYGLTSPATSALLAGVTQPDARALVFSIKQAGVPLGGVLAGLIAPLLLQFDVAGLGDWRSALVIVIAANLLFLLVSWLYFSGQNQGGIAAGGPPQKFSLIDLFRLPEARALVMTSFVFAGFQLALSTYMVQHLVEQIGLTLVQAGALYSVSQIAGIIGRFVWGALADWLKNNMLILRALAIGMVLFAIAAAILAPGVPVFAIVIVAIGLGFTAHAWTGLYMAELVSQVPVEQAGAITGAAMTITFTGVFVGPALFGIIVSIAGNYSAGYIACAFGCTLAYLLLQFTVRRPTGPAQ